MATLKDILSAAHAHGFTHCRRGERLPLERLDEDILSLVLAGHIAEDLIAAPFWHFLERTDEKRSHVHDVLSPTPQSGIPMGTGKGCDHGHRA